MLLQKEGYPQEGEVVLCRVTKIHTHGVFVHLEEYGKSGMIHISEIAPGRIRNMREFVKEDKIIVCVVLRTNQEKGYIDLSLRRVSSTLRRNKINQIKQEQKAEKIIEFLGKELKKPVQALYKEITGPIFQKYLTLYGCFEDIVAEKVKLADLGVKKEYIKQLEDLVKQRIKPTIVYIGGDLQIVSYEPNGVQIAKQILQKAKISGGEAVDIKYLGGGKYKFLVHAGEYKDAEKILRETIETAEKTAGKTETQVMFYREQKKIKKEE